MERDYRNGSSLCLNQDEYSNENGTANQGPYDPWTAPGEFIPTEAQTNELDGYRNHQEERPGYIDSPPQSSQA